jgi:hypothetical protein
MKDQQAGWNVRLSRRQMLHTLGVGATGMALAACMPVAGGNPSEVSAPAQEPSVLTTATMPREQLVKCSRR